MPFTIVGAANCAPSLLLDLYTAISVFIAASTMTVHTDLSVIRDHNVAFIITPLFIGVTIHVYIDVLT